MSKHKTHHSDSSGADLLLSFFTGVEQHFRFLEQNHDRNYISGLVEYKNNYKIIRPYQNEIIQGNFLALTRYERAEQAIEITFDKEHSILEGHIYYSPIQRFELSEILAAAKKDYTNISGNRGLTEKTTLHQTIEKMATALQNNIDRYLLPDQKLLQRALNLRNKRVEHAVRHHLKRQIERTSKEAAKAFRKKDYSEVVTLLGPLQHHLKKADLKKLKLASQHLHS